MDEDGSGWSGGLMRGLRYATGLVERNLLILLGCLAGGMLLGVGPSLVAGTESVRTMADEAHPWRAFWGSWRHWWVRANIRFFPVWIVGAAIWLDWRVADAMGGTFSAVLKALLMIIGAWTIVAISHLPRVVDRDLRACWKAMVLSPLLSLGRGLLVCIIALVAWALARFVPITVLLIDAAGLLWTWNAILGPWPDEETSMAHTG